jgi:hypothetical protein
MMAVFYLLVLCASRVHAAGRDETDRFCSPTAWPDDRVRCLLARARKRAPTRDGHRALGDALMAAQRFRASAMAYRAAAAAPAAAAATASRPSSAPWPLGGVNPLRQWLNGYARLNARAPQPRIQKWDVYLDAYHRHFGRFRGLEVNVVEIGVQSGGSLLMWKAYFGPRATVYGVDIDPRARRFHRPEAGIHVLVGDQGDPAFLARLCATVGRVDVAVDDGSHFNAHQAQLFGALVGGAAGPGCLNRAHGVLAIEDVSSSYMPVCGGGRRAPASFVVFAKGKVDVLNAFWSAPTANLCTAPGGDCAVAPTLFTAAAASVVFYSGIVFFEMNPRGTKTPWRLPRSVDVGSKKVPKWYWWKNDEADLRAKFRMPAELQKLFDEEEFDYNTESHILEGQKFVATGGAKNHAVSFERKA